MTEERGTHLAPPRSQRAERVLLGVGVLSLAVGVVCAISGADAQSGFVLLGAACVLGGIVERMRSDPSAWRISPSDTYRRVVVAVLGTLSALMGVAALFEIAGSL